MTNDQRPPGGAGADDACLVRADRALPGLRVLLDDDALTKTLRRHRPQVLSARAQYLRYKPGTAMVAAVRVVTDEGERPALAQVVSDAGRPKLSKLLTQAQRRGTWCHLYEGVNLALADAVADRHLPGLHRELDKPAVQTLRYKPGRRWVGRRPGRDGEELVKIYQDDRTDQAERGALAARSLRATGLPGPRVLRLGRRHQTLTFTWHAGQTLEEQDDPDLGGVGALLAALHQSRWPLPDEPEHDWRAHVTDGAQDLARVVPELRAPARLTERLVHPLAEILDDLAPLVTSHGDFSADQVLAQPDGTLRLLDLDALTLAPREHDLGEWIGEHLARVATSQSNPEHLAATALNHGAAMVSGYQERAEVSIRQHAVLGFAAIAVLRRVPEPFRSRHPDWIAAAGMRVRIAEELTRIASGVSQ